MQWLSGWQLVQDPHATKTFSEVLQGRRGVVEQSDVGVEYTHYTTPRERSTRKIEEADVGRHIAEYRRMDGQTFWSFLRHAPTEARPAAPVLPLAGETKYGVSVVEGQAILVNLHTGKPVPAGEPLFIFRGKDRKAVAALSYYLQSLNSAEHRAAVAARLDEFITFADRNGTAEPDTHGYNGEHP